MKNKLRILVMILILIAPAAMVQVRAQESEYKDTPWFSGMPNFFIYAAEDIEFDSYNFFNGKDCTTVEGRRFKRTYSLKEGGRRNQASFRSCVIIPTLSRTWAGRSFMRECPRRLTAPNTTA